MIRSLFISAWTCKRVEIKEVLCAQIYLVKNWKLSREASANKLDDLLTRARPWPPNWLHGNARISKPEEGHTKLAAILIYSIL